MKKNVAIYCRVSTTSQNVASQREQLLRYCSSRGWEIVSEFVDEGISGDALSRPGFESMLQAAYKGCFEVIVVYQLSRLGRSLTQLLTTIQGLTEHGVGVTSVSENISTADEGSPFTKVALAIFGALAEVELELIRERVRSGVDRAMANGVKFGRPHVGFDMGKAIKLRKDGLSIRKIAKQLGVSKSTLSDRLKDMD